MTIVIFAFLGLAAGSFVNALVWRLQRQEEAKTDKQRNRYSIANGRSMCPACEHKLAAKDLVPVFSWITLRGKCRYCRQPIHWQYPLVEASTAALFVISYVFWPAFDGISIDMMEMVGFAVWLITVAGLVALAVYDIRWMLLPNRIVLPLIYLATGWALARSLVETNLEPVIGALGGAVMGGGLFYLLFQLSKGKWIGGGDVKLGFLLGILLGDIGLATLMLFLASLIGVIVSLPLLVSGKVGRNTRIPFGPFLIISTVLVQLFGRDLFAWYVDLVL